MKERDFQKYLNKAVAVDWYPYAPAGDYLGAVVIPVLGEMVTLPELLPQLADPRFPVVLVINEQADSPEDYRRENRELLSWLAEYRQENVFWLDYTENYISPPGVGTARKIGLDAALGVVADFSNAHEKLLFSLDGDTLVDDGYFDAALTAFGENPDWSGAIFDFVHRPVPEDTVGAIKIYENYLRHYRDGLARAGSPYAYIPIGSAMVTRCDAYIKCGGMRSRAGGEDFYFLQALRKTGEIGGITGAKVYPSGRISARVPFGTGPGLRKIIDAGGRMDFEPEWVFDELRLVLDCVRECSDFYGLKNLPETMRIRLTEKSWNFFTANNFESSWQKIAANVKVGDELALRRGFMTWFDAFRTLKFIHFLLQ